jgi:hypothetical protein
VVVGREILLPLAMAVQAAWLRVVAVEVAEPTDSRPALAVLVATASAV